MFDQESNIKTNVSWETLLSYREVGYIKEIMQVLVCNYDLSAFEIWIYLHFDFLEEEIRVEKSNQKQIIFIIGDESNRLPIELIRQAFAIFKTYLPEKVNYSHLFHLPVGYSRASYHRSVVPILERSQAVFFAGNLHRGRAKLYQHLTQLKLPFPFLYRIRKAVGTQFDSLFPHSFIRFSDGFHNGLTPEEYSTRLYNSQIVLCPPGLSQPETLRHYEAMRAGCIVISEPLPNTYFYQGAPFVIVQDWQDAKQKIQYLLDNPEEMVKLQQRTLNWWHTRCSEQAAAAYIFSQLQTLAV